MCQDLRKLSELKKTKAELMERVQKYRDCDPASLVTLNSELEAGREGANRWTDNLYSLQSWIGKKFPNISVSDLNKQFGIPEDLDYVE